MSMTESGLALRVREPNPSFPILARRAFAKVKLEEARRTPGADFPAALKEFRAADRAKRKLDAEYREHHERLWIEEQQANATPELPL